jgi:hypothetical protein
MKGDRRLGLDELMIVNPSSSSMKAMYLGDDGKLYEVEGLGEDEGFHGWGQLEELSSLYELRGIAEDSIALGDELDEEFEEDMVRAVGQYFLGTDGTVYGVEL